MVSPATLGVTDAWIERLRDAMVTAYETRNDVSIDYQTETFTTGFDDLFYDEDDVFIEASLNPAKLALVRLMLGQGAVLRGHAIFLKGPVDGHRIHDPEDDFDFNDIPLHRDADIECIPIGAGLICHRLNCMWIGTDLADDADGPTLLVPASQLLGHSVMPHDTDITNSPYPLVRVEAKAGSVVIWQGGTFHSAVPRTRPGLRISLSENYTRPYIHGLNASSYIQNSPKLSPELLDRHPELKRVLGLSSHRGVVLGKERPPFDPYA